MELLGGVLCMGIGSTVEHSFVALARCFSSLAHPWVGKWNVYEQRVIDPLGVL